MIRRRLSPLVASIALVACSPVTDPGTPPAPRATATPIQCASPTAPTLTPSPVDASAWYGHIGGPLDQASTALAVDSHGNVIVTGHAVGPTDFGAGPVGAVGNQDLFITELDPSGKLLWARRFGGGVLQPSDVAVDSRDHVIVTGTHTGAAADLGGTSLAATADEQDVHGFIVELSAEGAPLWVVTDIDGAPLYHPGKIGVGPDDRVVVAAADLDDTLLLASVARDGTPLSLRPIGHIRSAAVSPPVDAVRVNPRGDVFLIGTSIGGGDVGGGPFTTAQYDLTAFVARYDGALGTHLWSKSWDAGEEDLAFISGQGLVVLGDDVAIASGGAAETDLGGGALATCSAGTFVARLDGASGTARWTRTLAGNGLYSESLFLTADGQVMLTARHENPVDPGGGFLPTAGTFAATYDAATGAFTKSRELVEMGYRSGDAASSTWSQLDVATAIDGQDHVMMATSFDLTASYGLGQITSQGSRDVLVARAAF
jgi:hypothetical protein